VDWGTWHCSTATAPPREIIELYSATRSPTVLQRRYRVTPHRSATTLTDHRERLELGFPARVDFATAVAHSKAMRLKIPGETLRQLSHQLPLPQTWHPPGQFGRRRLPRKSQGHHMNYPDRDTNPTRGHASRFRSTTCIALGSAVPASAPALALTGSIALCALVATLVVVCIALAALLI
jgi:hypothetical protein